MKGSGFTFSEMSLLPFVDLSSTRPDPDFPAALSYTYAYRRARKVRRYVPLREEKAAFLNHD